MSPQLSDGQVAFVPPGTFGSFVVAHLLRAAGNRADIAWVKRASRSAGRWSRPHKAPFGGVSRLRSIIVGPR